MYIGYSSVGRAAVSKTACREFETYYPATNAQVLRSLCVLFCDVLRFRIGSASLCQYQWKNYFYLHFRKICGFSGSAWKGRSGEQYFYLQYLLRARSFREAAFRHLSRLELPNSFRQLQREAPSPRELARRKP